MLASLSTLADRNFIVGFFLPVLIAAVLVAWLFQGDALIAPVWEVIRTANDFASLTLFVLAVWSLATLLSLFNVQLHRLLEGYYGPLSGGSRRNFYMQEFEDIQDAFISFAEKIDEHSDAELRAQYLKQYARSQLDYPLQATYVMPSRFGNVLSAMETYSLFHYGADGTALWSRLIAVIPENYQKIIDGGRAEVDFFVSGVFLALGMSVLSASSFGWSFYAHWRDSTGVEWLHLLASAGFGFVALVAYEGAIVRARGWGAAVRSAYDLYLSDLAKSLGYDEPWDPDARKKFWIAFSSMVAYSAELDPKYRLMPRVTPLSSKPRRSPDTV